MFVFGVVYIVIYLVVDLVLVCEGMLFLYLLFGVVLLIVLGFEFVNGFYDIVNVVVIVIYMYLLMLNVVVIWLGMWNFFGVMVLSGVVVFGIL